MATPAAIDHAEGTCAGEDLRERSVCIVPGDGSQGFQWRLSTLIGGMSPLAYVVGRCVPQQVEKSTDSMIEALDEGGNDEASTDESTRQD